MKAKHPVTLGLVYVAVLAQSGCSPNKAGAPESNRPRLVFITTGTNLFWQDAAAGIEAAASDFKAEFEIVSHTASMLDERATDGLAFTPINGAAQLVGADGRVCFVGVDHYKAGRKAAALAREAMPDGGKIFIFSQTPDFHASQERRQGIADELSEPKFVISEAGSKVAIAQHLDVAVMICLSARDAAVCRDTLCARDKLDFIKVIALEADARVREAVDAREVYGAITSQPYQYGYHAVRVLAGLARGDASVLPKSGFLDLPLVVLRSETASHTAAAPLHSIHDSTLFPPGNAGDLDRAAQARNLVADRAARERSPLR
jgi:ribose transport system substrate-binding protein